jgi:hypothetical protein
MTCPSNPQTTSASLAWEYRGDGLYIYWNNPFRGGGEGKKEDILMFLWPSHDADLTAEVENKYEQFAQLFCDAANWPHVENKNEA